jgi:hypothetical protein
MLRKLVRCSLAALASIALACAFASSPEGFTQAKKPARSGRRVAERIRPNIARN